MNKKLYDNSMGIKCMSKSVIKTKFAVLQTPAKFAVIMEIPLYYLMKAEMDILQILSLNKEDGKCTHELLFFCFNFSQL